MAWQHLYARVPAKISMFNKTDGYDTFACSEGITRDFAEKELVYVCDIKLSADDSDKIHAGKLSPVYSQFMCREGELVHSCITYLQSDYSGERSTYMVHSIVMTPDQHKAFYSNFDNSVINKSYFLHDLDKFNVTSLNSKPDHEYPEVDYKGEVCESPAWITEQYNKDIMRRFIYAILNAVCGKLKGVYVLLKDTGDSSSEEFCRFINSFFKVLPYHLRPMLSFATRVNNTSQLSGVKLKGIVADPKILKVPKCAVFELDNLYFTGIKDDDVNANLPTIDFLYSLFKNEPLRHDFLTFADYAVSVIPELGGASLNLISELIYLFRCGCGFYDENTVLPNDDKVLDMLTSYEKYRKAIPDEYRVIMMRCINRYPAARVEIPKKIFSKIQKLYPKEITGTKHVIMHAMLDLIHTDTMRDKLFSFIKSNYSSEDKETQLEIIKHISNVFYGGFLQPQILEFFGQCYPKCNYEGKKEILSKVLLVIRTKPLLEQLMAFLNGLYEDFDLNARADIYDTVIEQLPEGDELAENLLKFADDHIETELPGFVEGFDQRILKHIQSEQNRSSHPLLNVIGKTSGHCSKLIAEKVFTEWSGRKILYEYIGILISGDYPSQIAGIRSLAGFASSADANTVSKMTDKVAEEMLASNSRSRLSELMATADAFGSSNFEFLRQISDKAICPLVARHLFGVFVSGEENMSVEKVVRFGAEHPSVAADEKFAVLETYLNFKKCVTFGDYENVFKFCEQFPQDKALKKNIGLFAEKEFNDRINSAYIPAYASFRFAFSYLKTGDLHIDECYSSLAPVPDEKTKQADLADKCFAIADNLLDVCIALDANPDVSSEFKDLLIAENSGLDSMLDQIVVTYGSKAIKHFDEKLLPFATTRVRLVGYCRDITHKKRPGSGIVAKITGVLKSAGGVFKRVPEAFKSIFGKIKGIFHK